MRFLHTADWHLGRAFHGESLLAAQSAAIDHMVEVAVESAVDAVLVAGDIFDRALAPVEAVRLADEALVRLSDVCPVVVISGNHDSAARLGFGAELFDRAGVHVRTVAATCDVPIRIGSALVYAIPYLEPDLVRGQLGCDDRSHAEVLAAAMRRIGADRGRRPASARSIVVAHAFVAGGAESDSERGLSVGGAASVPACTFAGVDYVALGHLHGPQRVGANGRYAGSPLAFSFSEATQQKSLAVVDLTAGEPRLETIPCPVPRRLASLRGTLDELLLDAAYAEHEDAWVQVTLTDPVRPADAMARLRGRFPHAVVLVFDPQGAQVPSGRYSDRLRGLEDTELVSAFVRDVRGTEPTSQELALVGDALTAGRVAEVSA
jgi:exonuclease SbcD